MIGRIRGVIIAMSESLVLIEAGGVGYEVEVPLSTYTALGSINDDVSLHTHLVVREDAQLLYGFYTLAERELFRALIKVNKVGPKLAITILSGGDPASFIRWIKTKDVSALTALPGVGKKTAEKLVIDMEDRLPEMSGADLAMTTMPINLSSDVVADAEAALIGLGFKPQDAARALAQVDDPDVNVESLIKLALKLLA
ncbi:MAG: Holliday junction DNA helicase RuvA [Candidatus Azotimanducaceae bacterium]|jgi:Holliday junction DNA helicase RuvA